MILFINALLKSLIILGLIVFFVRFLKDIKPQIKYTLWRVVLVVMILIPLSTFTPMQEIVIVLGAAEPPSSERLIAEKKSFYVPEPQSADVSENRNLDKSKTRKLQNSEIPASVELTHNSQLTIHNSVFYIWLIGFAILMFRFGFNLFKLTRFRRMKISPSFKEQIQSISDHLGVKRNVKIVTDHQTVVPFTFGYFRPMIVLPKWIEAQSNAKIEHILLHEMIHIHRADYISNLVLQFTQSLHWFNPFVWMISKDVRLSCEISCDTLVVAHGKNNVSYASDLVDVAKYMIKSESKMLIALPMIEKSEIKSRVAHILGQHKPFDRFFKFKLFFIVSMMMPLLAINISDSYSFDTLLSFVKGSKSEKLVAARLFGDHDRRQSVSSLIQLVKETNNEIKLQSLLSMERLGKTDFFYPIENEIQKSTDVDVKAASLKALKQVGCIPAFGVISSYQNHENSTIRETAAFIVKTFSKEKLLNWFKTELQYTTNYDWVMSYVNKINKAGNVKLLMSILADGDETLSQLFYNKFQEAIENGDFRSFAKHVLAETGY